MRRGRRLTVLLVPLLALFASPPWSPAHGQQGTGVDQDSSLNNLVHPEDYETAPPGEPGRVEVRGSGPVDLVLVAGDGFGADAYRDFVADHRDDFTVHLVTLPGNEGTPAPPMPPEGTSYGEATWTRAAVDGIAGMIEERGLEDPVVLGHFYQGGHVAFRLAVRRPELIGGAIVVGSEATRLPADENRPLAPERRVRNVDERLAPRVWKTVTREGWRDNSFPPGIFTRDEAAARRLWEDSSDEPLPVMVRYLAEFFAADLRPLFPEVGAPTLVVRPGFSEAFLEGRRRYLRYFHESWEGAEEANERIEVETVPRARLFVWRDRPEAFGRLLRDFVDRLGRDRTAGAHLPPPGRPAAAPAGSGP